MKKCMYKCFEYTKGKIYLNWLDKLFYRNIEEKISNLCHLNCLQLLEIKNIKRNGRWAFRPIFGMLEFFSTLFSLSNLVVNILCYNLILKKHLKHSKLKKFHHIQYYICNFAFTSSILFHINETLITRYLDYFFAFLVILYSFYVSFIRLLLILLPSLTYKSLKRVGAVFSLYYTYHIYRMTKIEFDYFYNKVSCAIILAFTFFCHITIFMKYKRESHAKHILYFTLLFFIAGAIEIQDVPPYNYLLDSHAVWHLISTISMPFYFLFWAGDVHTHRKTKTI